MASRGILAFAAGLGTGWLNGKKQQEERDRQAKLDQITLDADARNKEDFAYKQEERRKQAEVEDQLAKAALPTYPNKTDVNADNLTQAMPKVFTEADSATNPSDTLSAREKAQHFMDNATPDQEAKFGNFYAKQGGMDSNKQFISDESGSAIVNQSDAVQKPMWKVMEDKSAAYLRSGKAEHQASAYSMLEQSQKLKAKDYQEQILNARKGGAEGLLKLANSHANEEMPHEDLRHEVSPDGKTATLFGTNLNTGKQFSKIYDIEKNGSFEDQLTQELMGMASVDNLTKFIDSKITRADASRKEMRDDRKVDLTEKKIESDKALAEWKEDRRDGRIGKQIEAANYRANLQNNGSKVTPTQQANNQEIDLARRRLTGMTAEDVQSRSNQYDATGRDNPNYDPTIANAFQTANQRKVGDDPTFDEFAAKAKPIKSRLSQAVKQAPKERFLQDPKTKGMKMGSYTTKGWEVRDADGKLVGHYK